MDSSLNISPFFMGEELKNKLTILPAYKSNVVDTTAAGDCFTAAMAVDFIRNGDIYKACDTGNKAGAIAVSRFGAADSMPTSDEILSFNK